MKKSTMKFAILLSLGLCMAGHSPARAESWCAYPLWVHEWGVQSFDGQGTPATASLPAWFHQAPGQPGAASGPPVRALPADGGMRALPVMHFYSSGSLSPVIPIGLEVGFSRGAATDWYPQVDARRTAAEASSAAAIAQRQRLVHARTADGMLGGGGGAAVPRDLTRQLFWDRLELSDAPRHAPHSASQAWVNAARQLGAMWLNGARESERFIFYEGTTSERPLVHLSRGPRYAPGYRHIVLHNGSAFPVHDVFLIHREGSNVYVLFAPQIPAGRSAGFVLEQRLVPAGLLASRTRGRLKSRLVDPANAAPGPYEWSRENCVMMRNPAEPVEQAAAHHLYEAEVELIVDTWGAAFFDQPGTTLLYREDTTYLDAMMPVSLYTDMFNFIVLNRMGLAVQRGIALP